MLFSKPLFLIATAIATVTASESGDATYFEGTPAVGACADKVSSIPADTYGVALSTVQWDDTAHCGATIDVTGPNGVTIPCMIVDRCMGCAYGSIDLYPDAFAQLADLAEGRIHVTWDWAA